MSKIGTRINVDAELNCVPTKAHPTDAAYDLFVRKSIEIYSHSRFFVPLGFRIQLPSNMKMLFSHEADSLARECYWKYISRNG